MFFDSIMTSFPQNIRGVIEHNRTIIMMETDPELYKYRDATDPQSPEFKIWKSMKNRGLNYSLLDIDLKQVSQIAILKGATFISLDKAAILGSNFKCTLNETLQFLSPEPLGHYAGNFLLVRTSAHSWTRGSKGLVSTSLLCELKN